MHVTKPRPKVDCCRGNPARGRSSGLRRGLDGGKSLLEVIDQFIEDTNCILLLLGDERESDKWARAVALGDANLRERVIRRIFVGEVGDKRLEQILCPVKVGLHLGLAVFGCSYRDGGSLRRSDADILTRILKHVLEVCEGNLGVHGH